MKSLNFVLRFFSIISILVLTTWSVKVRAQEMETEKKHKEVATKFYLRMDGGMVWQQLNDAAIPGDKGTKFDLSNLDDDYFPFYRLEGKFDFAENHRMRILYAPLTLHLKGKLNEDVLFNGKMFQAGTETDGVYRFNSYRISWAYKVAQDATTMWHVGVTGKVRDAEIALEQQGVKSSYTNVGFVPLLHVAYQRRIADDWHFFADLDAAAAPQGRAEDLGLLMMYNFNSDWAAGGGLRTLEGGADNDKVYTFSWLHYIFFSLAYHH